jgi:hypothetical protein
MLPALRIAVLKYETYETSMLDVPTFTTGMAAVDRSE